MAVKGNTNFTDLKSSKNKISGGNCNVLLSDCYDTIQQDHPPAPDIRGKDLKQNPGLQAPPPQKKTKQKQKPHTQKTKQNKTKQNKKTTTTEKQLYVY